MIRQFRAENYKALRKVDVDLSRLTVVVGPNGGGKTSLLEGMYLLGQLVGSGAEHVFESERYAPSAVHRAGADGPMRLGFVTQRTTLEFTSHWIGRPQTRTPSEEVADPQWSYALKANIKRRTGSSTITLRSRPPDPGSKPEDAPKLIEDYVVPLGSVELLQFDAARLAAPSYSSDELPRLEADGNGLASVLAFIRLTDLDRFKAIESALGLIVPSIRAVRFKKQKVLREEYEQELAGLHRIPRQRVIHQYTGDALLFDTTSGEGLPAAACSEGTLIVLGLLTVVLGPQQPRLILLDDIDHALHPTAQARLVDQLHGFLARFPNLQIVATSHSPFLIDHLRSEEVRITNITDDGTVTVGRLDEHDKFARWKDEMTPGEFWSMVGEKWLTQAPAAAVNE
jgi:predicted ATPase